VGTSRVLKGGSWSSAASLCRVSARGKRPADNHNSLTGFRVVIPFTEEEAEASAVADVSISGGTTPPADTKKERRKKKQKSREQPEEMPWL